jgi:hypothetical protein
MGASFRLRFGGEKPNCTRLDAPTLCQLGRHCLAAAGYLFRFLVHAASVFFCLAGVIRTVAKQKTPSTKIRKRS